MKIYIILNSGHYTEKQNQYSFDNMIELEWDLPFLPNDNDLFDCDSIIEDMSEWDIGLSWSVHYINYKRINDIISPIVTLRGE